MNYGVLLPLASLMSTVMVVGLFVLAALTAGASFYFFSRARHREAVAPARDAETSRAVAEMRSVGDRIETLVSQQQLQGETQRARLGQQIESVQQTVSQQGHRVDGLRAELHSEVQRRDAELEAIRQQLSDIQSGAVALPPAAETRALPPAVEASVPAPAVEAAPAPTAPVASAPFVEEPSGDSFAGAETLPPPPPLVAHDPFADAAGEPAPPPAPEPAAPVAPVAPPAPAIGGSMFSDMGFDAFAPGEPAGDPFAQAALPSAPQAPAEPAAFHPPHVEPAPPAPAAEAPVSAPPPADAPDDFTFAEVSPEPTAAPDGGAWIAAPRAQPDAVPVFSADDWDVPAAPSAPAPAAPAAPVPPAPPEPVVEAFVPPEGADDFSFISTVTEDVQRALYMAGVTKLEEMAHWSRGDARRISAQVSVSEETIMNQWVFEAQGALFERYSSGVGS